MATVRHFRRLGSDVMARMLAVSARAGLVPKVLTSLTFVSLVSLVPVAWAAPPTAGAAPRPPVFNSEIVLLLDPTGRIVYEKNAASEHAPASLVKLMSLYL